MSVYLLLPSIISHPMNLQTFQSAWFPHPYLGTSNESWEKHILRRFARPPSTAHNRTKCLSNIKQHLRNYIAVSMFYWISTFFMSFPSVLYISCVEVSECCETCGECFGEKILLLHRMWQQSTSNIICNTFQKKTISFIKNEFEKLVSTKYSYCAYVYFVSVNVLY